MNATKNGSKESTSDTVVTTGTGRKPDGRVDTVTPACRERTLVVSVAHDWNPVGAWLFDAGIPHRAVGHEEAFRSLDAAAPGFAAVIILVAGNAHQGQPQPGHALCRSIRSDGRFRHLPILWVVRESSPLDLYEAFNVGVSDYVASPTDPLEVILRLRTLLRRAARREPARRLALGETILDLDAHEVQAGERHATLTPRETAILRHLAARQGQPSTTEELLVEALGYPPRQGNPEVVRTHVRHLREKLETDPAHPVFLVNVPRVGYSLRMTAPLAT